MTGTQGVCRIQDRGRWEADRKAGPRNRERLTPRDLTTNRQRSRPSHAQLRLLWEPGQVPCFPIPGSLSGRAAEDEEVESGLSFELTGPESKARIQLKLLDRLCPSNNQDQSLGSKENFFWRFLFFGRLSSPSDTLGSSLPLVLCSQGRRTSPPLRPQGACPGPSLTSHSVSSEIQHGVCRKSKQTGCESHEAKTWLFSEIQQLLSGNNIPLTLPYRRPSTNTHTHTHTHARAQPLTHPVSPIPSSNTRLLSLRGENMRKHGSDLFQSLLHTADSHILAASSLRSCWFRGLGEEVNYKQKWNYFRRRGPVRSREETGETARIFGTQLVPKGRGDGRKNIFLLQQ